MTWRSRSAGACAIMSFATLLLTLSTADLLAQSPNGNSDCGRAEMIANTGYPDKKLDWALSTLVSCGTTGADAAARALSTLRVVSDTTVLESLTRYLSTWRDVAIYRAGMQLASDVGATKESRVIAFSYLYSLLVTQSMGGYGDFARVSNHMCQGSYLSEGFLDGRPLERDYVATLRGLGLRVSESKTEPREVRLAAACLTFVPKNYQPPRNGPPMSTP
jgi:hypothetical protein